MKEYKVTLWNAGDDLRITYPIWASNKEHACYKAMEEFPGWVAEDAEETGHKAYGWY